MKILKKSIALILLILLPAVAVEAKRPEKVRNLIFLIGDGMGVAHISMMQIENRYAPTAFDRARQVAFVSTRSANNRVTDSAAAGTALACGCKTNNGCLGLTPQGDTVTSILTRAQAAGWGTGIVVTSPLQHATPAAFYAHTRSRNDLPSIHRALLDCRFDVLFGGGYQPLTEPAPDGRSLFDRLAERGYCCINRFEQTDTIHRGPVIGAFSDQYMPAVAERGDYLPQAVGKALEILANRPKPNKRSGFVLMVEGSQIDSGGHEKNPQKVYDEMRDFEQAVAVAMDFADRTPGTLVVVVADHETGGLYIPSNNADFTRAENGLSFRFACNSHTAVLVPALFYGAGAKQFGGILDNTELSRQLSQVLGL